MRRAGPRKGQRRPGLELMQAARGGLAAAREPPPVPRGGQSCVLARSGQHSALKVLCALRLSCGAAASHRSYCTLEM